jgi:hypothetical protein
VSQQRLPQIIFVTIKNLVTTKAGAQYELFFNTPASGLSNISSCLAPALGVTKDKAGVTVIDNYNNIGNDI